MKKILFFLFASCLTFGAFSQADMKSAVYTSNTLDTVTNAATKYLVSAKQGISYGAIVTVAFTATEISGTTGGTATLQGSLDGTNWYTAPGTTAYTLTDVAAQTTVFKVTSSGEVYFRLAVVGTGTMSDQIKAKYTVRAVN